MHQPEFILVTGPNASGKTTFIEKNRPELENNGFDIIIPDNILKKRHSLYEGDPVNEAMYAALNNHKSFVLESPFQRDSLIDIISEAIYKGYKASLIQLLAGSVNNSLIRVEKRQKRGGLIMLPEEIRMNYAANMKNVAENYSMFETSHFVDNSEVQSAKLLASFNYHKITHWQSNTQPNLKQLLGLAKQAKNLDKRAAKIIKANNDFKLQISSNSKGFEFDWRAE